MRDLKDDRVKVLEIYNKNKSAKVGEEITCPICGEKLNKKQYSQAFCSLHCKDTFHNTFKSVKNKYSNKKSFGTYPCSYCGKEFTLYDPYERFCCDNCRNNYFNEQQVKWQNFTDFNA